MRETRIYMNIERGAISNKLDEIIDFIYEHFKIRGVWCDNLWRKDNITKEIVLQVKNAKSYSIHFDAYGLEFSFLVDMDNGLVQLVSKYWNINGERQSLNNFLSILDQFVELLKPKEIYQDYLFNSSEDLMTNPEAVPNIISFVSKDKNNDFENYNYEYKLGKKNKINGNELTNADFEKKYMVWDENKKYWFNKERWKN
ncbi:hypothetical protein HYY69_00140 [Candidatus Woesearchaeota archaeon]|nr:hypothetical protein [Candidatus Woesearchaeota archaeon]